MLREHGLGLREIEGKRSTLSTRCRGRRNFSTPLRAEQQVVIISDTFTQFARPLMKKLGLACHLLQ